MLCVEELGLPIWARQHNWFSFKMPRPSLRLAHSPLHCGPEILLLEVKWLARLRMSVNTPLPHRRGRTVPYPFHRLILLGGIPYVQHSSARNITLVTVEPSLVKGSTSLWLDLQKKLKALCRHLTFRVFNMYNF